VEQSASLIIEIIGGLEIEEFRPRCPAALLKHFGAHEKRDLVRNERRHGKRGTQDLDVPPNLY